MGALAKWKGQALDVDHDPGPRWLGTADGLGDGEVMLEAMDVRSGALLISESLRADSTELVGQQIRRLVAACAG